MTEQIQIQGRPVIDLGSPKAGPTLNVVAREHDYGTAAPAPDANLTGLMRGLQAFNPALQQYAAIEADSQRQEGALDARAAAAKRDLTGVSPEGVEVPAVDPAKPPAYANQFSHDFKVATARRLGIEAANSMAEDYTAQKDLEGFNARAWLSERRQKVLTGINDPVIADMMGRYVGEAETGLLAQGRRDLAAKQEAARVDTMNIVAADAFTAEMSPDDWAARFDTFFSGQAQSLQFDKKQAAAFLLQRVQQVSQSQNGMPELFSVFDRKDSEGRTLLERNPQLMEQIVRGREQAKVQSDRFTMEHTEPDRAQSLMRYESDIDNNPAAVTPERLLADMGKFGSVGTAEKAASLWGRSQAALQRMEALKAKMGDFTNLWQYSSEDQKKMLDYHLAPVVNGLVSAVQQGDPTGIATAAQMLMVRQSASGSTVPVTALEQLLRTNVSNLPNTDGPSPGFQSAVAIYKALSSDKQYRELYFKGDTADLMEAYSRAAPGVDPKTAYADAYRAISPEAKAAAEARSKDPAFQKTVAERATKMAEGSSFWPRWLGGNGRPENKVALGYAANIEARSYLTRFPDATDDQVQSHIDSWSAKSYVLDTTSNNVVKVPEGMANKLTQEALSGYSKDFKEQLRSQNRLTDDTIIRYVPTGTEGQLQVEAWDGTARKNLGTVNVSSLIQREQGKREFTPEDRALLGTVKAALNAGDPLPAVPPALMGKARSLKAFSDAELRSLDQAYTKQFMDRASAVPSMAFGSPSMEGLTQFPAKGIKVDNQLTSRIAAQFADSRSTGGGIQEHVGLAASLITMGEGVALRAYDDPASGAGKNIGMGYNLKANAATVDADLKRAGVPVERIDGVKNGTVELLPEQAQRLLQVVLPRYEKQAAEVAEETQPGLWGRMKASQKAVMIDLAWQIGDPGKYKKAWAALAAGKDDEFASETKVFYTNRQGQTVEDTRRGNLRSNILAGAEQWNAVLNRVGIKPSTKFQTLTAAATTTAVSTTGQ